MDYLWLLPVLLPAVGFFWSNCPCCGESCYINCPGPPDVPESYTVTVSGITNGTCTGCANLNGTHVLDFYALSAGSNTCRWDSPAVSICGGNSIAWRYTIRCNGCADPPVKGSSCINRLNSDVNIGVFGTGPYDTVFSGYGELVLPNNGPNSTNCSTWPANITISPA